ncbi:Vacuolar iron transporter like [Actinidia chinensis var. chinensis]|uniref:Vacuolar iron transporter n=1 Tax=Actinidia chinensis var. chinensis TaxID=1590841 RepID=A0A2R6QYP2_ACTCC|nr:Vacuolar iron transporter like [Actinidia chinensis var. chinensis]
MSLPTSIPTNHNEQKTSLELEENDLWLLAAILGGVDGLVFISSIMIGAGAVQHHTKATILIGVASLMAGSCGIAIAEYVSACSQLDMEVARMERREKRRVGETKEERERLLSPVKAAAASALAFLVGGFVPLAAGSFIKDYRVRMGVVMAVTSVALVGFGWFGAVLVRVPPARTAVRFFLSGWLAIAITFGSTNLLDDVATSVFLWLNLSFTISGH